VVEAISVPRQTEVRQASGAELERAWDDYVYRHRSASLFHLTAWKRAIERTFGFEPRYLVTIDGSEIRGVLPLFMVHNFLQGRALISIPFAVYGGICANDDNVATLLREAACDMARQEKVQYLELREQSPANDLNLRVKHLYVSFDQELPESQELLLQSFPRDTRYMIRKAQNNGLRAVVDNDQIDTFYEIYARSVHQLGTPVFAKRFFRTLLEEFSGHCEITIVWHNSRALAGVLSFRFRDWILPYYGGSLVEGRRLAANNFMYWEVMKRAIQGGARYFDFGRSKVGTGSYAFKTQWNMRERPLPYQFYLVERNTMPNYSPANSRFKLATTGWKRLPLPVAKILGPTLVRLFP